jgi:16S rRNA (guanine527-N7)-methyltransferase
MSTPDRRAQDQSPLPAAGAGALPVLVEEALRLAIALDARALERFARYRALLEEWNERAGLTTLTASSDVERRHFGEALALLAALREAEVLPAGTPARIADLGPGGGFPGVPIAIVEPAITLTLIESHARRAAFLEYLVTELALPRVDVVQARAEDAGRDPALRAGFDLVVARALAAMPVLVEYALPLLRPGGVLATPKGSRALDELHAAAAAIAALGGEALPPRSLSLAPDAPPQLVLLVRRTGALDDRYPRRAGIPGKRPLG